MPNEMISAGMSASDISRGIFNDAPGVAALECEGCGRRTHGYCQRCPAALCGLCVDRHECPAIS